MKVTMLVAHDENNLIGNGQDLPWHIPEDLKLFRSRTWGHPIICGRKTHDAIGHLPGRENIVVTRSPIQRRAECLFDGPGQHCWYVWDIKEGITMAQMWQDCVDEVFIVGGAQIYKVALRQNLADRVLVSKIFGKHKGDTYFPELDGWKGKRIEEHDRFEVWEYLK
jgi:dihydrofolate reductase